MGTTSRHKGTWYFVNSGRPHPVPVPSCATWPCNYKPWSKLLIRACWPFKKHPIQTVVYFPVQEFSTRLYTWSHGARSLRAQAPRSRLAPAKSPVITRSPELPEATPELPRLVTLLKTGAGGGSHQTDRLTHTGISAAHGVFC